MAGHEIVPCASVSGKGFASSITPKPVPRKEGSTPRTIRCETTRGAGHFVALAPVGSGLTALIPIGRASDPDTGRDWEGRGVAPDIAVPAETALDEALRRTAAMGIAR